MTSTDPPTPPEPGEPPPPAPGDPPPEPPKPLDPEEVGRLQGALAAERKARKKADDELEKVKREGMSDAERKIAEAKAEGRTEALREAGLRLLRAEVRAIAAQKLADPSDAVRLLDLDDFEPAADGSYDPKAIAAAIDKLVDDKPYLVRSATSGPPRVPQGTRGTPGAPAGDPGTSDGDQFLRGLLKPTR
jgi:hypothetical protein